MQLKYRILGLGTVVVALTAVMVPVAEATAGGAPARADVTSVVERRRVDGVATPRLRWKACRDLSPRAECATVKLPLDYDAPRGATVDIAVLRVKARKPAQRIGSLFVNPGGPGGSGVLMAAVADGFLGPTVLDRFDVVGFDPRGIESSSYLTCFKTAAAQQAAMAGFNVAFPWTAAEEKAYIASAKKVGKACSTTGKPLSGAMSTAEAARDMDVLRRAVGDKKLTYLGFSYGTALGQYYANMFPDRVRAVTVDGVINPVSWVGSAATAGTIQDDRLRSADGAYRALRELLVRCGKQGPKYCRFAADGGDPVAKFATLAQRLRAKPVTVDDRQITYADFIGDVLSALYSPDGYLEIDQSAAQLWTASDPAAAPAQVALAKRALAVRIAAAKAAAGRAEKLPNGTETFLGVACTDGRHPKKAESWPAAVARSDRRAPYFGRIWGWGTVGCAGNAWSVQDEDTYRGPFNRTTAAPVLFVGNYYDPATNYHDAVSSNRLLPGSRLISSDSWGHTAYGSSACVTGAVDAYLLAGTLPAHGLTCTGDLQPFTKPLETTNPQSLSARGTGTNQAPVFVPTIPSILLGTR
jgi:pimeloyl-ACP methyl ester carboxylesterase